MNVLSFRMALPGLLFFFLYTFSDVTFASGVFVYLSPPKVQETSNTDSVVATFNDMPVGPLNDEYHLPIGLIENPNTAAKVEAGSITGGARLSNYLMGGPVKILFEYPASYLGFWWSTIDSDNQIELYDVSDNLILSLNGSQITSFFSKNKTVQNGDGIVFSAHAYDGNPSVDAKGAIRINKATLAKKYLYCNIFVDGPDRIHSMIIRGGLFEIDNIAISPRHSEPNATMIPMLRLDY